MRDIANLQGEGPKWILLDGDIDPMWIESLNTVMDDNKILTLASNERLASQPFLDKYGILTNIQFCRIAVTPEMKLIFEISNLRTATPATVSRAGKKTVLVPKKEKKINPFRNPLHQPW